MNEHVSVDELVVRILKECLRDAKIGSRKVAERIDLAIGTALSKTKKLEKAGIIKGHPAVLEHERLGCSMTVVTGMTVSKGKLSETEKELGVVLGLHRLRRHGAHRRARHRGSGRGRAELLHQGSAGRHRGNRIERPRFQHQAPPP